MRVCLVSANRFVHDPRARALAGSLGHHQVEVVAMRSPGEPAPGVPEGLSVRWLVSRWPPGPGKLSALLRRLQPSVLRRLVTDLRLALAARRSGAAVLHPTSARAVRPARWAALGRATVVRDPGWPPAGRRDLIWWAPHHPASSLPGPGRPPSHHVPGWRAAEDTPAPDRHRGTKVVLCYRRTPTSPGRYLEAALRRAGIEPSVHTDRLDWDEVDPAAEAVLFVESPLPALDVVGTNPGVPVAFWVHHGEHHLPANLRLGRRYGADLVLLAHSWHLAHRFPVAVERFPFAVAPEVFSDPLPHPRRDLDVAFVGSHLFEGGPYRRRQEILRAVSRRLPPDRLAFREGVPPEEAAALYARTRIVLNEGGPRHFPITMRVFEAIGAGALLVTEPAPGLDRLFREGDHYLTFQGDPLDVLEPLLRDPDRIAALAEAARRHALIRHTYDHRVDELLAAVARVTASSAPPPPTAEPGLASVVDEDPEVQRVLALPATELRARLPDREVWDPAQVGNRLRPGAYDAVVLATDPGEALPRLLEAARRYVYADTSAVPRVDEELRRLHPQALVTRSGPLLRAELGAEGYRIEA